MEHCRQGATDAKCLSRKSMQLSRFQAEPLNDNMRRSSRLLRIFPSRKWKTTIVCHPLFTGHRIRTDAARPIFAKYRLVTQLTRTLFSKLLYGLQIIYPVTCRSAPPLRFWPQLGSLACCTNTDIEHLRIVYGGRIDRRAALGAECLGALGAALGSFHIVTRVAFSMGRPFRPAYSN